LVRLREKMETLASGNTMEVTATDPGFANDVAAWCRQTQNELVSLTQENGRIVATIRKGQPSPDAQPAPAAGQLGNHKTLVVFSQDLDRVMAAFVIANGAAAMGNEVTMFFTFWGLNVLRREDPPPTNKSTLDRMFGWMMPRGPQRLKLSNMNMAGMGTAMMKKVMRDKNVDSLPALIASARAAGVRMVACSMSMDVMGIGKEELIDGVEIAGVGGYLGSADQANVNLFI
jgi:peroxiredoxin family protein/TusA-related sulfurtransferase